MTISTLKHFTTEEKAAAAKEFKAGTSAIVLAKRLGVSQQSIYSWRKFLPTNPENKNTESKVETLQTKYVKALKENELLKRKLADLLLNNFLHRGGSLI